MPDQTPRPDPAAWHAAMDAMSADERAAIVNTDDFSTWSPDDLGAERAACSAYVIPGLDTRGNRYWINRRANIDAELNRRAAVRPFAFTPDDAEHIADDLATNDPDQCETCGKLDLCDCRVYLVS